MIYNVDLKAVNEKLSLVCSKHAFDNNKAIFSWIYVRYTLVHLTFCFILPIKDNEPPTAYTCCGSSYPVKSFLHEF